MANESTAEQVYETARGYADAGLSVIPLKLDGSKAPAVAWDAYKTAIADDKTLRGWFSQGNCGIGIIGGAVSGNLERIDFDLPGSCKDWANLAKECGYGELIDSLPLVRTPRSKQCYHLYYRCETPVAGNQPLARYLDSGSKVKVAIETRGEGGYTIAPGSPTSVHETGNPYVLVRGDLRAIPAISADDREALLEVARSFNGYVPNQPTKPANRDERGHGGAPGDDYNTRGDWRQLPTGQGWSQVWSKGEVEYWRRPGKSQGVSATWNYAGSGLFYVFTSNALPFEPERSYTPFGILPTILYGGDYKGAAKALSGEGYGTPTVRGNGSKSEEDDTPGQEPFDLRLTDAGNARALVTKHGSDIRYDHDSGQWLMWSETHWQTDRLCVINRLAEDTVRDMYSELSGLGDKGAEKMLRHIKGSLSKSKLDAMADLAGKQESVAVNSDMLDCDNWLLNCRNGVVDLKSGKLRPHNRADLMTKLAPVDFDPAATCPRWIQFLDEVFASETELIAYVQRAIGYTLTGDTSEQVFFMLHGNGSNGKSTLINAVREIMSDYHVKTGTDTILEKQSGGIPNDIARLRGARFVSSVEANPSRRLAEELVKELTGSDAVTARFLRKEFFDFVPTFKLWLACNHKPSIDGQDNGIWRRIKLIPFTVQFDGASKDSMLPDKLRMEYPGILRWMVEGCLEWQMQGLGRCAKVDAATSEYRSDMDVLAEFIDSCCIMSPTAQVQSSELYAAYSTWCEGNGIRHPYQQKTFTQRLQERGFEKQHTRNGKTWFGVTLRETNAVTDAIYLDDEPENPSTTNDATVDNLCPGDVCDPCDPKSILTQKNAYMENKPEKASHPSQSSVNQAQDDALSSIFGDKDDVSDWDSLPAEPTTTNGEHIASVVAILPFICGNCKQAVELTVKSRNVYQYECPSCGYQGVLPDYDYRIWLERKELTQ